MAKPKTTPKADASQDAEPTAEERLHTIRSILRHKIDTSKAVIASLSADLANPDRAPLDTLAWSSRAFEAAGVLQVAHEISQRLDTGESIVDIHAGLQREALRCARSQPSSTSPASNFAAACRTSALAEFEDLLRYDAMKLSTNQPKVEG
jgi:hypothetical protein